MPERPLHSFPKAEKLCSRTAINNLFSGSAQSVSAYPIRAVFAIAEKPEEAHTQILISVSKRFFKHAVDRNRLKRLVRESYRLHKELLIHIPEGQTLHIAFLYQSHRILSYAEVETRIVQLLTRINECLSSPVC